jgi:hypothetical protein
MTLNSYEKYMVINPLREVGKGFSNKNAPVMTYMSNDLVPGCNKYIDISWIKGLHDPNPHIKEDVLDYDRVLFFVGATHITLKNWVQR